MSGAWRRSAVAITGALAAFVAGCSGFDRLDFVYESAPPDDAIVSFEGIEIHAGIAVGVEARPVDGDEIMDEDTQVELDSRNPGVLGIAPAQPDEDVDNDDKYNWKFVVFGVGPGTTQVVVTIDGEIEAEIPAVVQEQ